MGLSIFNSDKRVALAILSTIVILTPLGILNIAIHLNSAAGEAGTRAMQNFFNQKIQPLKKYDIVFLGDSRVLTGINPEFFEQKLHCSAYNASFSGGGLNGQIYKHTAEKLLSSNTAAPRAVILGITAMNMGTAARGNYQYNQITKELLSQRSNMISDYVEIPFQKIRTKDVKALFKKKKPTTVPYANGYLERFAKVRKKAQESSIKAYTISFKSYTFSQESLQELIEYIKLWKNDNITVFAFRPPVNIAMDTLENESGKCDFALIRNSIEQAGGIWLDVDDRESYNSYDSSHLASHEAIRLSQDLSDKVAKHFQSRK